MRVLEEEVRTALLEAWDIEFDKEWFSSKKECFMFILNATIAKEAVIAFADGELSLERTLECLDKGYNETMKACSTLEDKYLVN